MNIKPIKAPEDHIAALARTDAFLMMAEENTSEVAELKVLAAQVEKYESRAF